MLRHTWKIFCLLIIAVGFFWAQASDAAGWVSQFSGTVGHLKDIQMWNHNTGFAVGELKILKTTNTGKQWSIVYSASGETYNGVAMASESVAWAVGNDGKILKTIDGGSSWQAQNSGVATKLTDIAVWSATEVLAVGNGGVILRTLNGGDTWTQLSAGGVSTDLYEIIMWFDMSGQRKIWITTTGGNVLYGSYYGSNVPTWITQNVGTSISLQAFTLGPSSDQRWAAGTGGGIFTSLDGGTSWALKSNLAFNQTLYAITQTGGTIYAAGAAGSIYKGVNSGGNYTWSAEDTNNITNTLYGLSSQSSPLTLWAVGTNGKIIRYDETLPSSPSGLTKTTADNVNTPSFQWSAASDDVLNTYGSGVVKYEYSIDGGAYVNNGSGLIVTLSNALTDGSHTIAVRAVDAANNIGDPTTLNFAISAVDTTTPVVTGVTPTSATVSVAQTYSANYSDNIGVASCQLVYDDLGYVPMTVAGGVSGTATKSYTFSSVGSHTLQAKCYDAAGNTGLGAVTTITVSAVADTVAPTVGAISPATATVNSAQSFTNSYSDNVGVTSCELYVNDITQGNMSLAGTTSGTATKSYTFSSAGSYAVKAKCSDGTNTTWGAVTTVVVGAAGGSDITAPTGSVTINNGAEYTKTSSVTLTLSCSDNVACTRMIVAVDGTVDTESMESFSTSKTVSLSSGDGTKTVAVKFKDSATNTSAQYIDTIILDTTAQDTVITAKPASNNLGLGDFYFGYTGSSITPVTFECRLDTGVFSSCESPKSYSNLSVGNHTFQVRAVDAAGNVDATADSYTWSITSGPSDTTSPVVGSITPVTAQATVSQSFTASYSDAVGVASCDLYVDSSNQGPMNLSGTTAGTASRAYTFTNTASHTLQARCSDAVGNTGLGSLTTVSVSAAPVNAADTSAPSTPSGMKKVSDDYDKTPTFTWNSSSDNNGVTSYVIQVDNGSLVDIGGAQTYTPSSLSDGSHTIKVFAKDAAGNSSPVASFEFTVKTVVTDTPVFCSLTINGAYKLTGSPAVYYITDECTKRPFNKANVFFTYFDAWSDVKVTTKTKLDKIPLDTLGFMPWGPKYDPKYGALVKIVSDPKVYLLLGGEKYWITAEAIFTGLKYSWNWVEDIDKKLLDKYVTGSEINYTDHHPNYTLVKYSSSTKVYRLEPDPADSDKQVKRHIKNEKVFNALNFRWDRIVTISKSETYKDGEELGEDDV